jgi:hypothetical protein
MSSARPIKVPGSQKHEALLAGRVRCSRGRGHRPGPRLPVDTQPHLRSAVPLHPQLQQLLYRSRPKIRRDSRSIQRCLADLPLQSVSPGRSRPAVRPSAGQDRQNNSTAQALQVTQPGERGLLGGPCRTALARHGPSQYRSPPHRRGPLCASGGEHERRGGRRVCRTQILTSQPGRVLREGARI